MFCFPSSFPHSPHTFIDLDSPPPSPSPLSFSHARTQRAPCHTAHHPAASFETSVCVRALLSSFSSFLGGFFRVSSILSVSRGAHRRASLSRPSSSSSRLVCSLFVVCLPFCSGVSGRSPSPTHPSSLTCVGTHHERILAGAALARFRNKCFVTLRRPPLRRGRQPCSSPSVPTFTPVPRCGTQPPPTRAHRQRSAALLPRCLAVPW